MRDDPRKYRHRDSRPHTIKRRGDLILRYVGDDAAYVTGNPYVVRRMYDQDPTLDGAVQLASGTLAEMEEVFGRTVGAPEPSETFDHHLDSTFLDDPEDEVVPPFVTPHIVMSPDQLGAASAELDRVIADMDGGEGFKLYTRGLKRARRIIFEGEGQ